MFKVQIPEDITERVEEVLETMTLGSRDHFNGNYAKQVIGLSGELTVKRMLGLPETIGDGFDSGIDFHWGPYAFDVKVTISNYPPLNDYNAVVKFTQFAGDMYKNNAYIFCQWDGDDLWICGAIRKQKMAEIGTVIREGDVMGPGGHECKSSMVVVTYGQLMQRDSEEDFVEFMEGVKL